MYVLCVVSLGWCGFVFFFSSRRRHTRCLSDWSSDVCSSDLPSSMTAIAVLGQAAAASISRSGGALPITTATSSTRNKIGRASCRERVEIPEGDGASNKKTGQGRRESANRINAEVRGELQATS